MAAQAVQHRRITTETTQTHIPGQGPWLKDDNELAPVDKDDDNDDSPVVEVDEGKISAECRDVKGQDDPVVDNNEPPVVTADVDPLILIAPLVFSLDSCLTVPWTVLLE